MPSHISSPSGNSELILNSYADSLLVGVVNKSKPLSSAFDFCEDLLNEENGCKFLTLSYENNINELLR